MIGSGSRRLGINGRPCHPTGVPSGDPSRPHDDPLPTRHDSPSTDRAGRRTAHRADVARPDPPRHRGQRRVAG